MRLSMMSSVSLDWDGGGGQVMELIKLLVSSMA